MTSPPWSAEKEEGFFKSLTDALPQLIWCCDGDGRVHFMNKQYADFVDSLNDECDSSWLESVYVDDQKETKEKWETSVHFGQIFQHEYRMCGTDGDLRWFLGRALPLKDESGIITGWVGTATDIEVQKKLLDELRVSRDELNIILEGVAEGVARQAEESYRFLAEAGVILSGSLDIKTTIRRLMELITPRIADWSRIDFVESLDGMPTHLVYHQDPSLITWAEEVEKRFPVDLQSNEGAGRVVRTGKSQLYKEIREEFLKHKIQEKEHFEIIKSLGMTSLMIVPIVSKNKIFGALTLISSDSKKKYTSFDLTVAEDIGRRAGVAIGKARLYESERKARREAENASKAKSTFLANMSHEMRTPLNALIGFNELLRNEGLDRRSREEYHEIMARNGDLLLRLIDDILDLSKVEAGHLTLEYAPVFLPDLIAEVTMALKEKAARKNLNFLTDFGDYLPQTIITDSLRLKQILNNVIGNAVKFTTDGFVELSVKYDFKRSRLSFRVQDSGPGIRPEFRKTLFQPFSQADPSVTRKFGGTGLGLVLSRKIAQSLGGDLKLLGYKKGQGACFVIEISVGKALSFSTLEKNRKDFSSAFNSLFGRRILVVEDSPDNQLLVKCILQSKGVNVELAENGRVGVDKALCSDFDLVLMDVQMPVMDGYSAIQELKNNNYSKPIIALTAHAMREDKEKCMNMGCVDYLTKPIHSSVLIAALARHIGKV